MTSQVHHQAKEAGERVIASVLYGVKDLRTVSDVVYAPDKPLIM